TPLHPASGLDYAICAGSGFFEELSSDANTSVVDGGVYASCAACGLMSTADYGDKIFNGQFSANGVAGIAIGIAQHITYATVIHAPYFEANLCAMILISAALGIDIIHPVVTGGNQQPILDLGNTSTFGTWRGSNGSSVIDQPVGVAGYTTLPVTETPTNRVFNIRGPVAVIPWQQNLLDAGGGIST